MSKNTEKDEIKTEDLLDEIDNAEQTSDFTLMFNSPFEYEGRTFNSLNFDFSKLTGKDYLAIEDEMARHGKIVLSARLSGEFLSIMSAKACTEPIGVDCIEAMPIKKFEQLRNAARNFFNTAD